jgi:hypothetical protein
VVDAVVCPELAATRCSGHIHRTVPAGTGLRGIHEGRSYQRLKFGVTAVSVAYSDCNGYRTVDRIAPARQASSS